MTTAATFYDGVIAVSHAVIIAITDSHLSISTAANTLVWQYDQINIIDRTRGIFSYEAMPDARLIINDAQIIASLAARLPAHRTSINWRFVAGCSAVMTVVISMVFFIIPALSLLALPYIPYTWDTRLGTYVDNYYASGLPACSDKEGKDALASVVSRLTAHIHSPYRYQIEVINLPVVNAMAFPGGYIIVFDGLIKQATEPDELAGILAHEIGHSEKRHGMEVLVRGLTTSVVLDAMTGGGSTALYLAKELNDLKYSRAKEKEADDFAFALMRQENVNPLGMMHFFARMHANAKENTWLNAETIQFLSNHPGDEERMKAAQESYDNQRKYQPIMTKPEWNAIKNMCPKP